jgi:hypothetical protein
MMGVLWLFLQALEAELRDLRMNGSAQYMHVTQDLPWRGVAYAGTAWGNRIIDLKARRWRVRRAGPARKKAYWWAETPTIRA